MQCQSSCWLSSIVGPVFMVEAIVVLNKKSRGLRHISGPYICNGALVKFIKQNKKTYQRLKTHMHLEPSPCPHASCHPLPYPYAHPLLRFFSFCFVYLCLFIIFRSESWCCRFDSLLFDSYCCHTIDSRAYARGRFTPSQGLCPWQTE